MFTEEKAINTIKKLSLEMVLNAQSGHCGSSLDCASILYAIYHEANVCPKAPNFFNRDRIVLSNGHAVPALYSILHLCGFDVSVDDLRDFRKLGSKTPGHPENLTPGVDCSTGALGQGIGYAVGLAVAETMLAKKYNTQTIKLIDHHTFVVCGDGDLMEGVSYESFALAGKWNLNKLIVIYNKNNSTIDGSLENVSNEEVRLRFKAQGFDVIECKNNCEDLIQAIKKAKINKHPTIIISQTLIADSTPYKGKSIAHSHPFTCDDVKKLNAKWGLSAEPFEVDLDVYKHFRFFEKKGQKIYEDWLKTLQKFKTKTPNLYKSLFMFNEKKFIKQINSLSFTDECSSVDASNKMLQVVSKIDDNFVGGCADLAKSTKSYIFNAGIYDKNNRTGKNVMFGVREHAMGCIVNGIVLHGGLRSFASTFLAFSDYAKYPIRLGAMMNLPTLYLLTHDSIGIGEDGPTHQPVEQLESLRLMPNVMVFRPYGCEETKWTYLWYELNTIPTIIALSKNKVSKNNVDYENFCRGAYIIGKEKRKKMDAIIIATGADVEIAVNTKKLLEYKGFSVRVVSMPCRELFEKQDDAYKEKILPSNFLTKVSIEAGVTRCFESLTGRNGASIGVNTFGESGSSAELYDLFGFSALNVANVVQALISKIKK